MSDLEHLSKEYLMLQERFDRIKLEPPPSNSDFLNALMELAEAAQKLKDVTAQIADRFEPPNRPAIPHLRLVNTDND